MSENVKQIVCPTNTGEVCDALRLARESGLCIHPCGSRSKFDWLNSGDEGMYLHTGQMNSLLEHTWQDMTCTVQAGCTWQQLQASLEKHGQQVALDALWPHRSTVGGVIATNDSGPLRLKYGSLRDLVIGMTVVLADGTVARSGGKVVKNVAGYDLPKLFCGSFGTLGIITEVTFRLHSIKQHRATLSAFSKDAGLLNNLLLRVLASHLNPESMQLRMVDDGLTLDLRLAARPDVLESHTQEFKEMTECVVLNIEGESETKLWNARESMFSISNTDERLVYKSSVLPKNIAHFLNLVAKAGGQAVAQATGIITGWVSSQYEQDALRLRAYTEASGGSFIALQLPPSCSFERWGALPSGFLLMRSVKKSFDPYNLLNPGRYLGGI